MRDFNLSSGDQYIEGTDYVVQQIECLLDATPGDLLGDDDYGTDYEYLLHDLKLSGAKLQYEVQSDIESLDLLNHEVNVEAMLLDGTEREIALVNIDIKNGNRTYNKTYNIR